MFNYSVKVNRIKNPRGKMVAFASLVIEDVLEVRGFKIFNGAKGYFVSPPSKQDRNDPTKWHNDIFWHEEGEKDGWNGPVATEIYNAMINEFTNGASSQSQASQKSQAVRTKSSNDSFIAPDW